MEEHMPISRREILSIGSAAVAATTIPGLPAFAQAYPSQDLHMVNGFPPGSGADVLTRYFAEKVRPLANRPVIVENKVGASGAIAVQYSAQAKPDGHTMYLSAGSATAAQMYLYKNPPVQVLKAFQIAATLNRQAFMLVVDANSPYKTVQQLTEAMNGNLRHRDGRDVQGDHGHYRGRSSLQGFRRITQRYGKRTH
jgi:tripartite-type tricarboxylate transporter receptor subunit TctC